MAVMSFSTQTTTPFKRSCFAPIHTYFWLCPRAFSASTSFRFSCSAKSCCRGKDCRGTCLAIHGHSRQIKLSLRHEIKPFSSGCALKNEQVERSLIGWSAMAEEVKLDRFLNGRRNNSANIHQTPDLKAKEVELGRCHNGSYDNFANIHQTPDLTPEEYKCIESGRNERSDIQDPFAADYERVDSSKNERSGTLRYTKRSRIPEHAPAGLKPHFNSSSGVQKASENVQFVNGFPQQSAHTIQPGSNVPWSINDVCGSMLSPNQLLENATKPTNVLLVEIIEENKTERSLKQHEDIPAQKPERDNADIVQSGTLIPTQPVECTDTKKSSTKTDIRERLESIYDKVFIVDNISVAKEVVSKLTNEYRGFIHACDTEVAKIEVKQETPVDHGEITCFSIYSGPGADFGHGKSCVWVDVLDGGGKDILLQFAPFFEDPSIKKVWHNYSFDCHVIENYGLKVSGFHGDTMHMARLWDSSRRTEGGYSLEALTGDSVVMCDARVSPGEELFGKVSMKTIFGRKKLKKDGMEGKVDIIPSVEELQREERKLWISYSALDSISTLMLYESLKFKLTNRVWKLDGVYCGNMLNFYERYWLPFGEILVQMETEGMLVDRAYLAELEKVAKTEQEIASTRFRNWASKHCPDAKFMNVGSDAQLRQLFFGGTLNKKDANESLEYEREFKVPNIENIIEEGKKSPTKFRKITIHKIGDRIKTDLYTASGWPSVSGDALKALAGKVSADFEIASEADDNVEEVSASSNSELSVVNSEAPCTEPDASGYGTAYKAFRGGKEGMEACHAIASLCEVCSIDSLISNFILPLQGGEISGKNGRIHCSLNINTETGRLSARRPNLQNQPALEKDRYKIRQAFIAAPGNSLIVADYGQLELRILAHLANCKSMLAAFEAGGDFHSRTALNMYSHIREAVEQKQVLLEWHPQPGEDKPPVPLLKDAFASERRKAKMLNFSIAYGKTTVGLARDWKVSVEEAEETVKRWYSDRKEVLSWQEKRKAEALELGYVQTLLGRSRKFPSLKKASKAQKGHIERAAINTPVQGSAADVAMCAMLEISKNPRLRELGWKLLLQVHDEVILEGPTESADEAKGIVVECMSKPFDGKNILRVGLSVDAKCAQNWYSAK